MHNKSKSNHAEPFDKVFEPKKYKDLLSERRKILAHISIDNQEQPSLSLSQIGKMSPMVFPNRVIATQRKNISLIGISSKKQQIKEKIKDRIKAQIHNLINRNTFKIKKIESGAHYRQSRPSESVSIVGASVSRPFTRFAVDRQNKNFKRSVFLSQMAYNARKVKSSLGGRISPSESNTNGEKGTNQVVYRRSLSTDIRVKNIVRRKGSQVQLMKKMDKNKDDALQPWIISSFVEEQQNF